MRNHGMRALLLLAMCFALAIGVVACGGDDDEGGGGGGGGGGSSSGGIGALPEKQDTSGKKGGKLTVLNASDVDYIDPARRLLPVRRTSSMFVDAQDAVLSTRPTRRPTAEPDLAEGQPEISDGRQDASR